MNLTKCVCNIDYFFLLLGQVHLANLFLLSYLTFLVSHKYLEDPYLPFLLHILSHHDLLCHLYFL